MSTDYKSVIESRLRRLQKESWALEAELQKVSKWGEDIFAQGTVMKFKLRYAGNSQWYNYTAQKVAGAWYIGGGRYPRMTWSDMTSWWSKHEVKKIRIAVEFMKLEDYLASLSDNDKTELTSEPFVDAP